MQTYSDASDETLAALFKSGDPAAEDALYARYKPVARALARPYFLLGGDREDLLQEGMIGLCKAVRDYADAQGPFHAFAEMCIRRQILTAITAAARQKHQPLNSYISLYGDTPEHPLIDTLRAADDPADAYLTKERREALQSEVAGSLSPLEKRVLALFLQGRSYKEIATALGRSVKSVDNSLQRIKRKLEEFA